MNAMHYETAVSARALTQAFELAIAREAEALALDELETSQELGDDADYYMLWLSSKLALDAQESC